MVLGSDYQISGVYILEVNKKVPLSLDDPKKFQSGSQLRLVEIFEYKGFDDSILIKDTFYKS